jgi:hypothetical protein
MVERHRACEHVFETGFLQAAGNVEQEIKFGEHGGWGRDLTQSSEFAKQGVVVVTGNAATHDVFFGGLGHGERI